MMRFTVISDRWVMTKEGQAEPYVEVLYGRILDTDLNSGAEDVGFNQPENHRVLIGDPQTNYEVAFNEAPNAVYNDILFSQQGYESRGLEAPVRLKEGTVFELLEDGSEGRQYEAGEMARNI